MFDKLSYNLGLFDRPGPKKNISPSFLSFIIASYTVRLRQKQKMLLIHLKRNICIFEIFNFIIGIITC